MKKIMIVAAGAMAFSAIAQEVEVPAPIAVPAPVVVAVPTVAAVADEVEPGALCKTYLYRGAVTWQLKDPSFAGPLQEWLGSAIPVDQAYDAKSMKFDAKNIAKHSATVAQWEGVFMAKMSGQYVITASSPCLYGVSFNGTGVIGCGQNNFAVNLQKGANKIVVWRSLNDNFSLDYRLATSTKPAKPITPAMLMHVVEEEEEW